MQAGACELGGLPGRTQARAEGVVDGVVLRGRQGRDGPDAGHDPHEREPIAPSWGGFDAAPFALEGRDELVDARANEWVAAGGLALPFVHGRGSLGG